MRAFQFVIGAFLIAGGSILFAFSFAAFPFLFRVFHSAGPASVLIAMGLASFIGGLYLAVNSSSFAGINQRSTKG